MSGKQKLPSESELRRIKFGHADLLTIGPGGLTEM